MPLIKNFQFLYCIEATSAIQFICDNKRVTFIVKIDQYPDP